MFFALPPYSQIKAPLRTSALATYTEKSAQTLKRTGQEGARIVLEVCWTNNWSCKNNDWELQEGLGELILIYSVGRKLPHIFKNWATWANEY